MFKTFNKSKTDIAAKAMYGHSEIVQLLLNKGAQVNTNGDGETAIDLAYRYPDSSIYLIWCSFFKLFTLFFFAWSGFRETVIYCRRSLTK